MNIYEKKSFWKISLTIMAIVIVAISLYYTNRLARELAEEERKKVELWASASNEVNKPMDGPDAGGDITFLLKVITNNTTIPVILTDEEGKITDFRNIDPVGPDRPLSLDKDSTFLYKKLENFKASYPPISIDLSKYYQVDTTKNVIDLTKKQTATTANIKNKRQYIYYDDSTLLKQLKQYPYIQLGIVAAFIALGYVAFNTARRAEQNKVWLGMAKETAHQLGTPLSSMVAWVEILKETEDPEGMAKMVGHELNKDVDRLKLIADRFSKIGSSPELKEHDLIQSVERTVMYVKRRASSKVAFSFTAPDSIPMKLNPTLFDWVIENLLKNALDAMDRKGKISVKVTDQTKKVCIEVTDTGKGIPKSKFQTIFEPGFSTKKRGWGLGLSLSKRIIENYHAGKIMVSQSTVGKGTTFKITLPKT